MFKIAVAYDNGKVFQDFGKCMHFMICDVDNVMGITANVLKPNGVDSNAIFDLLSTNKVDALICGKISKRELDTLNDYGIKVNDGVSGDIAEAIKNLINKELLTNDEFRHNHCSY